MNDEEIASHFRDDLGLADPEANELASALVAEARSAAPYTRPAGHDEDDLRTEGLLRVRRTLASYDADRGVPLATYFRNVILRRRFIDLGKRGRLRTTVDAEANRNPPCTDHRREQLRREVRDAISHLLPNDPLGRTKAEAFALYHLAGYKLRELAVRYRVSVAVVWRWIKQCEADFRRLWLKGTTDARTADPQTR